MKKKIQFLLILSTFVMLAIPLHASWIRIGSIMLVLGITNLMDSCGHIDLAGAGAETREFLKEIFNKLLDWIN